MKNPIIIAGAALSFCMPFIAAGADHENMDMDSLMEYNSKNSGSWVRMNKWVFRTDGVTDGGRVTGFMFAKETSNHCTLTVKIDGVTKAAVPTSDAPWGTKWDIGGGAVYPAGKLVEVVMRTQEGWVYRSDDTASDGFCHLMVLDFPGYNRNGYDIPSGLWLGWEDWLTVHDDYNDFCMILRGCNGFAITNAPWGGPGDTVPIKPRIINPGGNRIISWREENTY